MKKKYCGKTKVGSIQRGIALFLSLAVLNPGGLSAADQLTLGTNQAGPVVSASTVNQTNTSQNQTPSANLAASLDSMAIGPLSAASPSQSLPALPANRTLNFVTDAAGGYKDNWKPYAGTSAVKNAAGNLEVTFGQPNGGVENRFVDLSVVPYSKVILRFKGDRAGHFQVLIGSNAASPATRFEVDVTGGVWQEVALNYGGAGEINHITLRTYQNNPAIKLEMSAVALVGDAGRMTREVFADSTGKVNYAITRTYDAAGYLNNIFEYRYTDGIAKTSTHTVKNTAGATIRTINKAFHANGNVSEVYDNPWTNGVVTSLAYAQYHATGALTRTIHETYSTSGRTSLTQYYDGGLDGHAVSSIYYTFDAAGVITYAVHRNFYVDSTRTFNGFQKEFYESTYVRGVLVGYNYALYNTNRVLVRYYTQSNYADGKIYTARDYYYSAAGIVTKYSYAEYNTQGAIIRILNQNFHANGVLAEMADSRYTSAGIVTAYNYYTYDTAGKLTRFVAQNTHANGKVRESIDHWYADGKITAYYYVLYDAAGVIQRYYVSSYHPGTSYVDKVHDYRYENGRLVRLDYAEYSSTGTNLNRYIVVTYHSNGVVATWDDWRYYYGLKPAANTRYEYSASGILTRLYQQSWQPGGEWSYSDKRYDANGNLIAWWKSPNWLGL